MAGYFSGGGGVAAIASLIGALLSGMGGIASGAGSALGTGSEIGSALSSFGSVASPVGSVISKGTEIGTGIASAGGGGPKSPLVGGPQGGATTPGGQKVPSLTPNDLKTGLANIKSEGQAAGLAGVNEDYEYQQLAQRTGLSVDEIKQRLASLGDVNYTGGLG